MRFTEQLNYYVNIFLVALFIAIALVGAVIFYLLKVKKVMAKEEKVNYDTFNRKDSTEFVKFDNLINCNFGDTAKGFGVVVINKYTFLAYLDVRGYDFARASMDEKQRTIINSVAFTNIIDDTITMRQSVKAINLDYNIEEQTRICKEYAIRQMDLEREYDDTVDLLEQYVDNDEMYRTITKRLKELQRTIVSTKWLTKESERILKYMQSITSSGNATKINQLVVSYTFNPNDYVEELSEQEIYLKACAELSTKANNYSALLGNCGCRCKLMTGMEVLDLIHRHYHPFTCDDIKITDLFNSSYNALFISSDSILRSERDRVGQNRLNSMLKQMNQKASNSYKSTIEQAEKYTDDATKAVRQFVAEEQQNI